MYLPAALSASCQAGVVIVAVVPHALTAELLSPHIDPGHLRAGKPKALKASLNTHMLHCLPTGCLARLVLQLLCKDCAAAAIKRSRQVLLIYIAGESRMQIRADWIHAPCMHCFCTTTPSCAEAMDREASHAFHRGQSRVPGVR